MDKKKILIADDETSIRSLVRSMLGKEHIVIGASDGEEATKVAHKEKPDLILMDIMMPKMDGYAACYAIKTHPATEAIPVVMLTGVGYELNKKLSQMIGASGYITKPFQLQELKEMIGQLLSAP